MIVPAALREVVSPHRDALTAAFGPIRRDPTVAPPKTPVLFLCFTNRCGSNFAAQILASTGVFNEAGEFFNAPTVLHHAARLGLASLPAYFAALPSLVPPHTCLAVKASADQLAMLADAGVLEALGERVAYLLLERNDRLGQAISRVIAAQTGLWTTKHAAMGGEPVYDRAAIDSELGAITLGNALFYAFFTANGIAPLHFSYESIMASPAGLADAVGTRLGFTGLRPNMAQVTIRLQRDTLNDAWRRIYAEGK
jgi:LPS sulfotransferase NodH